MWSSKERDFLAAGAGFLGGWSTLGGADVSVAGRSAGEASGKGAGETVGEYWVCTGVALRTGVAACLVRAMLSWNPDFLCLLFIGMGKGHVLGRFEKRAQRCKNVLVASCRSPNMIWSCVFVLFYVPL
jgi:hypothetical protein